ncbi:MAG: hypothetical protein J6M93_07420 [Succinivibrio sp.]|nr:hypothetical protein [Succinivibrio sp.]
MNQTELDHLLRPNVSHICRSLYSFYLRPLRERGPVQINLADIANYLGVSSPFFPTTADLRLAGLCLEELEATGFISRKKALSPWQGAEVSFPFFEGQLDELPHRQFHMTEQWRPSAAFSQTCLLVGLDHADFSEQELNSFISYWSGRDELRNQTAWERAFAQRLKKKYSAKVGRAKAAVVTKGGTSVTAPAIQAETAIPIAEGYQPDNSDN